MYPQDLSPICFSFIAKNHCKPSPTPKPSSFLFGLRLLIEVLYLETSSHCDITISISVRKLDLFLA